MELRWRRCSGLRQSKLEERVRFQFENSRSFGTTVLPNILFMMERDTGCCLVVMLIVR